MIDTKILTNLKINKESVANKDLNIKKEASDYTNKFKDILKDEVVTNKSTTNDFKKIETLKNEEEPSDKCTIEETIEKITKAIDDSEDFQGNKLDDNKLENIILLLSQLIQQKDLKSNEISGELNVSLDSSLIDNKELTINKDNFKLGKVNNDILRLDTVELSDKKDTLNEAINLANNILEMINSDDFKDILSSKESKELAEVLNLLNEKLFSKENLNSISSVNIVENPSMLTNKENKKSIDKLNNSKVDVESKVEVSNEDVDNTSFSDELKKIVLNDNTKDKVNTKLEKSNDKSDEELKKLTEEEKVLSKILDSDKGLGKGNLIGNYNKNIFKPIQIIDNPIIVNKQTMDMDIIKNVKYMVQNAVSELKVKIYPKELGEITIKILSQEGIMRAEIKATSKETYNLINSNLNDIKKGLEQQNIKIQDVNVGIYQEDATFYSGENSQSDFAREENKKAKNKLIDFDEVDSINEDGIRIDDSNVNLLA
ncbi:flagellar hook-length control protein FliK [Clostridium chauvoei]|uniref:Flagellar hook-length control protein FliK n=2 Tax=Clostridium chauvoei TaxID=46867 RepID=A0ABD4RFU9_9CLOT|nr:flagellar hook-length control protein FliK [Clostridium chauvoei]ATD54638.1 hypothetical protein BTM20_05060 [Clostridium chauvoei]ATD57680.1 hypothetical protein BTM21_07995 [Clostridium chauvoei]MBX7279931.1 flagellar hook-length control protein FliK [Clostridium chauvoei]MBX7282410.1 flagellar hook-length control protein FliK [Clostridium chauvoei]MBX7284822.1 flagellar hook-length control protein FliK [Clostridium chauvoei]